jgi:hypothetical protein
LVVCLLVGRVAAGELPSAVEEVQDCPLGDREAGLIEQTLKHGAHGALGLPDVAGEGGDGGSWMGSFSRVMLSLPTLAVPI